MSKPHVCPLCSGSGTHAEHKDAAGKCAVCHGERIVWGPKESEPVKYVPAPWPVYPWPYWTYPTNPFAAPRVWATTVTTSAPVNGTISASGCNLTHTHSNLSVSGTISTRGSNIPSVSTGNLSVSGSMSIDGKPLAAYVIDEMGKAVARGGVL